MPKEITIKDLGTLADDFVKIIKDNKLENHQELIFDKLVRVIQGKLDEVKMVTQLEKDIKLGFMQASGLVFDLKEKILDKPGVRQQLRTDFQEKIWSDKHPNVIADLASQGAGIDFASENIKDRYYEAVLSYLKGVRDYAETNNFFTKSEKIGGIGLPTDQSKRVLESLAKKKQELAGQGFDLSQIMSPEEEAMRKSGLDEPEIDVASRPSFKIQERQSMVPEGEITIDKLLEHKGIAYNDLARKEEIKNDLIKRGEAHQEKNESLVDKIEAKEDFLESKEEIAPPPPQIRPQTPSPLPIKPKPAPQPQPFSQSEPVRPSAPPKAPVVPVKRPEMPRQLPSLPRIRNQRETVSDIKAPRQMSRPVGPVDELGSLSVADLRRLSSDPQEAILKIRDKIDLLEDESLVKRDQGIKALKNSPLYKAYSDIMTQALNEGKSFEAVIEKNQLMTLPEFKAIMDLNKTLKY